MFDWKGLGECKINFLGNEQRNPNLCLKTLGFYTEMDRHDSQGCKSKTIFNLSGKKKWEEEKRAP